MFGVIKHRWVARLLEPADGGFSCHAILESPKQDTEKDLPEYLTPIADALLSIHKAPLPCRTYVFHAPASTGKSAAAAFFMKTILLALPHAPNGFMISGVAPNDNYVSHMAILLGAEESRAGLKL